MYERILVPLDGSEFAEQVLPYAEALAEKFGSQVILLTVVVPTSPAIVPTPIGLPVAQPISPYTAEALSEAMEDMQQESEQYLQAVAKRLKDQGMHVDHEVVEGWPADVIVERSKEAGASLIAMTTHGRGGLGRLVMGSVADEVLRKAPCPVLLVRVNR
jgi:nucleotide-binding universal stress UspA family protein